MPRFTNFHIIRLRRKDLEKLRDSGETRDLEGRGKPVGTVKN